MKGDVAKGGELYPCHENPVISLQRNPQRLYEGDHFIEKATPHQRKSLTFHCSGKEVGSSQVSNIVAHIVFIH